MICHCLCPRLALPFFSSATSVNHASQILNAHNYYEKAAEHGFIYTLSSFRVDSDAVGRFCAKSAHTHTHMNTRGHTHWFTDFLCSTFTVTMCRATPLPLSNRNFSDAIDLIFHLIHLKHTTFSLLYCSFFCRSRLLHIPR